MRTVNTKSRNLGLIVVAFQSIKGPRPIMLSYKIGKVLAPVKELLAEFQVRLAPFVDQVSGGLRGDLTEAEQAEVEVLMNEDLTFEVPPLSVPEIGLHDKLTVEDDSALPFLVEVGVLTDD